MQHRWTRRGASIAVATTFAATGLTAAVIGTASSTAGASAKPFKILMFAPLSSQYLATNAQTETIMAKAAVKVVNKSGGAGHGRKVELTVVNTGTTPTTAVSKLDAALSSKTKPTVFINGNASAEAAAELPIAKSHHILMFNQAPTTTSGKPTVNPTSFDLSPSTPNYVQGFVAYTKSLGFKSVAIFHGNDAYGTSIGKAMTAGAKAAGFTVTSNVGFKVTALTFTPTLQGIQATKPQVLWLDGYGAPPTYTLNDVKKLGWTIPMIADDSYSVSPTVVAAPPTGALGSTVEKNLKFETFAAGVYSASPPKNTATMIKAMKATGSPKASLLFGYEYDAVIMAAYAARSAGATATGTKLAKAVVSGQKSGKVPTGLFPSYGYTSSSHFATVPATSFAFVAPSKLVTGIFGTPTG